MSETNMPVPDESAYRDNIDPEEAAALPADDPNVAANTGTHNHEDHIGDEAPDADTDEVAQAANGEPGQQER